MRFKNTAGSLIDAIYSLNPQEEVGQAPLYDNLVHSDEWIKAHGFKRDPITGHYDDAVKLEGHPTHPSRGRWIGRNIFDLTDKGFQDPNYIFFGVLDGDQDPQATLTYKGGVVLPEITVTPKKKYFYNSYDNIKIR